LLRGVTCGIVLTGKAIKPSATKTKHMASKKKKVAGETPELPPQAAPAQQLPSAPVKMYDEQGKALEVPTAIHSAALRKIGAEIVRGTLQVALRYVELVEYIRSNSLAPKLVSFELGAIGFARTRISELNRIAHSSDAIYAQFQAGKIGIKKALELTRGNVVELGKQLLENNPDDTDTIDVASEVVAADEAEAELLKKSAGGEPVDEKAAAVTAFNKHAIALMKEALRCNRRKATWRWEGMQLKLSVEGRTKANSGDGKKME